MQAHKEASEGVYWKQDIDITNVIGNEAEQAHETWGVHTFVVLAAV